MAEHLRAALTILRRKQVEAESGYSRSTIYLRISQGLFIKPVALGARAVGWPAGEVSALNAARIAGKSEADIRALVARLHAGRGVCNEHLTPHHAGRPHRGATRDAGGELARLRNACIPGD
jgi:prophage regulatory protein